MNVNNVLSPTNPNRCRIFTLATDDNVSSKLPAIKFIGNVSRYVIVTPNKPANAPIITLSALILCLYLFYDHQVIL